MLGLDEVSALLRGHDAIALTDFSTNIMVRIRYDPGFEPQTRHRGVARRPASAHGLLGQVRA
jgi:hypothetical protein